MSFTFSVNMLVQISEDRIICQLGRRLTEGVACDNFCL